MKVEPEQRQVELVLVVLLHRRYIETGPLEGDGLKLLPYLRKHCFKVLIVEEVGGSEETHVQGLVAVEVSIVVVEYIHVLQLLCGYDLLLEQHPDESVSERNQGFSDMFGHFQVDNSDLLAFGTLVDPREVIDAAQLQREFR